MSIREIQRELFKEYIKNGYLEEWTAKDKLTQKKIDIAELGLVTTEISEAMEIIRQSDNGLSNAKQEEKSEHLAEECADVIIRVLNFMSRKGFDFECAVFIKNTKNLNRGKLHGKDV